jgi:hypothetical protein
MADSGQYPLVDDPARNAGSWAAAGPSRTGYHLRAAGLGAGSGLRDAEASAHSGAETGQHPPADGGSAPGGETTLPGDVVVPPADSLADHDRLPIFEAVESDWFAGVRPASSRIDESSKGWSSPGDDGWRAAEVVHAPTSDGTTPTGLPKRRPQANLVPGTAATPTASGTPPRSAPGRSAAGTRDRFASFQRGIRQGRAAAAGANPNSGEGTTA